MRRSILGQDNFDAHRLNGLVNKEREGLTVGHESIGTYYFKPRQRGSAHAPKLGREADRNKVVAGMPLLLDKCDSGINRKGDALAIGADVAMGVKL